MRVQSSAIVTVTIDTEEDDWGSYEETGASTRNIAHLPELQARFDKFGVRPTYLVNRPPLIDSASVRVLGELAQRDDVEIGAHCHPWNTPPLTGAGADRSMMSTLSTDENRGKIREVTNRITSELGVSPTSFRAGRWGFGPTVAQALVAEGYAIDCSVSPFTNWQYLGGPDYGDAPHLPYRCDPTTPLEVDPRGPLAELPTTVGFVRGAPVRSARWRRTLENVVPPQFKVVGAVDRAGLLTRRWLSPETSTGAEMIKVAANAIRHGAPYLSMTFHSSTLLPGVTPFVKDDHDRQRFLRRIDELLSFCERSGLIQRTVSEAAEDLGLLGPPAPSSP